MLEEHLLKQGAVSWTELSTTDPKAAAKFYSEVFGWEYQKMDMEGIEMGVGPYHIIKSGGREIGGIMGQPPQAKGTPPSWMSYVTVDDVDATAKKVEAAGGKILMPGTDIPETGRMIVFQDPQGAVLAAITYSKDLK